MTLREAQEEYKILEAEETYWLEKKEIIKSIVLPKAADIKTEVVDGGKREDKMLLYVEKLDNQKINETIDYIRKQKLITMKLIEKLLIIRNEYQTLERRIYDLRNDPEYIRTHNKPMAFWKIGNIVGYSKAQCFRIYNKMKQNETKKSV